MKTRRLRADLYMSAGAEPVGAWVVLSTRGIDIRPDSGPALHWPLADIWAGQPGQGEQGIVARKDNPEPFLGNVGWAFIRAVAALQAGEPMPRAPVPGFVWGLAVGLAPLALVLVLWLGTWLWR
ncbi:MAG TPA: hypothetical protein ENJ52_10530 [Aliiroseovarius sp.]|nr:hypothetical protein [Aliiroseovarius sp.]